MSQKNQNIFYVQIFSPKIVSFVR